MSQPLHNKCAMLLDVHITLILCSQQWINPWKLFVELYTFLDVTVHFEILISTDLKNVQTHTHISVNANILTFVLQCADSERREEKCVQERLLYVSNVSFFYIESTQFSFRHNFNGIRVFNKVNYANVVHCLSTNHLKSAVCKVQRHT